MTTITAFIECTAYSIYECQLTSVPQKWHAQLEMFICNGSCNGPQTYMLPAANSKMACLKILPE
jgi:hypothetical protein